MKELGVIQRWGRVLPGREKEAVELFAEGIKYYGDKLADGSLTYFEPFLYLSGDEEIENGFFVMKGPEAKVQAIFVEPRRLELESRAVQLLAHLSTEMLLVGEAVPEQLARFAEVNKVLVTA